MNNKRIVVTGTGVISSIGIGTGEFWRALIKGESGISKIESFDTAQFRSCYGAEVKDFQAADYIDKGKLTKMGTASIYSIAAAKMALEESGLDLDSIDRYRAGISLGTTMGEIALEEKASSDWVAGGIENVSPSDLYLYPSGNIPLNLARELGIYGPNMIIPTACAAGNYAIGHAFELLQSGQVDMMLAGGVDPFSRVAFTGFDRLLSVAPELCSPFDLNRKGIIVGEGAGLLVLETLESAEKRDAPICAELLGYGLSCDAYKMTAPHPKGLGGINAVTKALKSAGIAAEEIGYISAHGTGTPENDRVETLIIKEVFGRNAYKTPMSSIKSMIGHSMGAASAIEAVTCCCAVRDDIIPPTMNYSEEDPRCDLDYVTNRAREHKVNIALSNAFAFGGNNASILIKKYQ